MISHKAPIKTWRMSPESPDVSLQLKFKPMIIIQLEWKWGLLNYSSCFNKICLCLSKIKMLGGRIAGTWKVLLKCLNTHKHIDGGWGQNSGSNELLINSQLNWRTSYLCCHRLREQKLVKLRHDLSFMHQAQPFKMPFNIVDILKYIFSYILV